MQLYTHALRVKFLTVTEASLTCFDTLTSAACHRRNHDLNFWLQLTMHFAIINCSLITLQMQYLRQHK